MNVLYPGTAGARNVATNDEQKPGNLPAKAGSRRFLVLGFVSMLLWFAAIAANGQGTVTLAWTNTGSAAGYYVYQGTASHSYTSRTNVGKLNQVQLGGLIPGTNYFFAVTAYSSAGIEGAFSSEVSVRITPPRVAAVRVLPNKQVTLSGVGQSNYTYSVLASTNLQTWTVISSVTTDSAGNFSFTDAAAANFSRRFYRLRLN